MEERLNEFKTAADAKTPSQDALINHLAKDLLAPRAGHLMSFQDAPDNATTRLGLVTLQGLENIPRGIKNAVVHDFTHPAETLETLGTAAGMAVVLKTVLPEGGLAGKLAGAAIGTYFTYKAAEPILDSYKKAHKAQTLNQLDLASKQFGDAGGAFIVNSAVAAVGYKLGSQVTDRVLSSRSFDGFADSKAKFYKNLGSRLSDSLGITSPKEVFPLVESKSSLTTPNLEPRVKFTPSEKQAPAGELKGEVDPAASMEVTVMLKSRGSDLRMERTLARIAQGRQAPLSDADFAKEFGAKPESLDAINKFANDYGLKVSESDLKSGRVVLNGSAGDFSKAFDTRLSVYENAGVRFRGREGSLTLPAKLADHIVGILGTDDRPQARAYVRFAATEPKDAPAPKDPSGPSEPSGKRVGYMPNEVADAYNFPKEQSGNGQAVAVIELGGGIDKADNAKYYKDRGLPEPEINIIEVGGAKNKPGFDSAADGEVMLDSQVIGVVAPKATQHLIFAPNSDKGFIDAITRATFPENGEKPSSAISISWGAPEELWTKQGMEGMSQAFKKAALKGISIFAASGDDGAIDRSRSGRFQVDYPASDPSVTGTGGTRLTLKDGKVVSELAWNNNRDNDAGGGGVSQNFPVQDFQKDANLPLNANPGGGPGRGVPDIAGNADPLTGYKVRVGGKDSIIGGTSAVSPLYSALTMRINEALGKPVGSLNPWLYRNTSIFNDIVEGNNNGYTTGPGWDAVTGLGSLDGSKMLAALKANPNISTNFGQFKFLGPAQIFGADTSSQNSAK
ncbi:MAG: S53 family peptidase [Candidatus Obscuribacterales bacterium]|nr:S53 family peptidase [Candidatus Obscuribacterales bacterium]